MTRKDPRVSMMNAIMGNKDLSFSIDEALNAPVGSTKRRKAQSILGSLGKHNGISDGQGGALDWSGNWDDFKIQNPGQQQNPNSQMDGQTMTTTPSMLSPEEKVIPATEKKKGTIFFSAAPSIRIANTTPYMISETPKLSSEEAPSPTAPGAQINNIASEEPAGDDSSATSFSSPGTGMGDVNGIEDWWNSLSEDEKKNKQFLYDSLKSGTGENTFALMSLSDKEKMKKLFPGVPEDQLPSGATYFDQYDDIEKNLREEYKIDTMESNLSRLQQGGVDIESDLNGYMTARDSYIQKLDNMINSAKDKSVTTDLSNPNDQKTMDNYLNYLYVMKGRQQKRYADFVKQAVGQYETELKTAQDAYDTNYKAFTSALSNKKDIYKEDYKNYQMMLEEMYKNVESREKTMYDQLFLQDKLTTLLKDQADTALYGSKSSWQSLTDSAKGSAQAKFQRSKLKEGKSQSEINKEWNKMTGDEKLTWYGMPEYKDSSSLEDSLSALFPEE